MDLDVLFVGTAGSAPSARRGLPATLVRRAGDRLLFDCGEGTQRQLVRSIGLIELEEVFLTHFHADHVLGLPGMLKTFSLRQRERPLIVHGPPGLRDLFRLLGPLIGRLSFPLELVELEANDELDRDGYRIAAYSSDHVPGSVGYAVVEDARPGVFDPARAKELGVTPGPDFGRLQGGETVNGVQPDQVMGAERRGRKIVITGDTAPCDMTRLVGWEADLIVHEATFLDDEAERAAETRHSTARGAARLAAEAEVRMLALTHVSPRYGGHELRDEARAAFAAELGEQPRAVRDRVIVPRDFDRVEIPFPERGAPLHVKAADRPPTPELSPAEAAGEWSSR
jgi:ribonuclease Z